MGAIATSGVMRWRAALRLGRISNLPTVWSNVIAATTLAGGTSTAVLLWIAAAMSAFYLGGMILNDAFDRELDADERPERPIPAGEVSARTAFMVGFILLGAGALMLAVMSSAAGVVGLALGAAILLYDWHHKRNSFSPLIMGLCRALVYLGAGAALGAHLEPRLLIAALVLMVFVAGLTVASKQERLALSNFNPLLMLTAPLLASLPLLVSLSAAAWASFIALLAVVAHAIWLLGRRNPGNVGTAVSLLIAGIALVDALAIASVGGVLPVLICFGLFLLTLVLQRYVPGT